MSRCMNIELYAVVGRYLILFMSVKIISMIIIVITAMAARKSKPAPSIMMQRPDRFGWRIARHTASAVPAAHGSNGLFIQLEEKNPD